MPSSFRERDTGAAIDILTPELSGVILYYADKCIHIRNDPTPSTSPRNGREFTRQLSAEVHAFTTTESKVRDIKASGAKEVIYVDTLQRLAYPYKSVDYMISTIPVDYDVGTYSSVVKPYGTFTQVGMPKEGLLTINHFALVYNRVNFNGSAIGGIPETQEVIDYCARNKIYPEIQMIKAEDVNEAWRKVVNKKARYRYMIDAATI